MELCKSLQCPKKTTDRIGHRLKTVSGAEAAAEAVSGEKVPETGGTGEETAAETEKTEASSDGMPLEEATEQPSGTEGDGIPENPAEDSPENEKEDGEASDQPSESVSGSEKEPKENHADKPEDEPADEPEDIGTVLNLNGCKTVSGILTGEAPFSVKALQRNSFSSVKGRCLITYCRWKMLIGFTTLKRISYEQ